MRFLPIPFDRIEIEQWGWFQCVSLNVFQYVPSLFDPLTVEISKNHTQWLDSKGIKLAYKENIFPFFPIPYELSPCRDGRFNMETLRTGRILTPKRPIAANRYWIGLGCTLHHTAADSRYLPPDGE